MRPRCVLQPAKVYGMFLRVAAGSMVPEFDEAMWKAPIGQVQGPIETEFGYHLILVSSRTDEHKTLAKRE